MELQTLQRRLRDLREDRASGAIGLALEALNIAGDWIAAGRRPEQLAAELEAMHPAIAAVANVGIALRNREPGLPDRLAGLRVSLIEGNHLIAEKLRNLIPSSSSVITISNSSTVRESLLKIGVNNVYVLESRPAGEGSAMAGALRKGFAEQRKGAGPETGGTVHLVPDAAMGNIVAVVDCALVGIDTYDPAGAILHKTGTLPLALCCKHFSKPFYAAGHSIKWSNRQIGGCPEPGGSPAEQFFDRTPAELITQIITEQEEQQAGPVPC